ncbi:MAG: HemK2/MTQ2 family protein methyltransferase [Nanoarchaeota archaeon]
MIYAPSEDSELLAEQVKKFAKNKKVLDLGSGSGIQAETAISSGAFSVLASDIDQDSIKLLKSKNILCIKSDLFSKINEKFDLVIFNPPYLPEDKKEDTESKRATTGGKKGDEIILGFIKNLKKHLNKNAFALLLISSLTPKNKIKKEIKEQSLSYEILSEKKLFFEALEVWKIEVKGL